MDILSYICGFYDRVTEVLPIIIFIEFYFHCLLRLLEWVGSLAICYSMIKKKNEIKYNILISKCSDMLKGILWWAVAAVYLVYVTGREYPWINLEIILQSVGTAVGKVCVIMNCGCNI